MGELGSRQGPHNSKGPHDLADQELLCLHAQQELKILIAVHDSSTSELVIIGYIGWMSGL